MLVINSLIPVAKDNATAVIPKYCLPWSRGRRLNDMAANVPEIPASVAKTTKACVAFNQSK